MTDEERDAAIEKLTDLLEQTVEHVGALINLVGKLTKLEQLRQKKETEQLLQKKDREKS